MLLVETTETNGKNQVRENSIIEDGINHMHIQGSVYPHQSNREGDKTNAANEHKSILIDLNQMYGSEVDAQLKRRDSVATTQSPQRRQVMPR